MASYGLDRLGLLMMKKMLVRLIMNNFENSHSESYCLMIITRYLVRKVCQV